MKKNSFLDVLAPPAWLDSALARAPAGKTDDYSWLRWVIELSRINALEKSGGPFAAAVVDRDKGALVAAAVNQVEALSCSSAHAEILALGRAQKLMQSHDLARAELNLTVYSSAQPCLMCFGAFLWSGARRLVYGAAKRQVEKTLGFDEGPLPRNWRQEMQKRGVSVRGPLLAKEAVSVFDLYLKMNGSIYNPSR